MSKQYVAQVQLITSTGDSIEFLCTPGTHNDKIKKIKRGRHIIEERVRFIEKQSQKVWSFDSIKPFGSFSDIMSDRVMRHWRHS